MIIGLGNDIVHIDRIEALIERFGERFINRSFSNEEIMGANHYPHNDSKQRASYFAKRFAAKEAFSKAIGTGFRNGLRFKHIFITNSELGRPILNTTDYAQKLISELEEENNSKVKLHISLSDDYPLALATVIIESI